PGRAWSLSPLFWKASEIPGVYAKEYYEYKLKVAPPAKYAALDFPVRVASDGNIALRGMGIIDGVQLKVGDRVLVKGQALAEENGIYTVSPGGWSRSFDANDNADFNTGSGKPIFVLVEEGRANKNTGWNLRDDTGNVTLGTTPLYFERTMVSVREMLIAGTYTFRSVPYQPFITLPILASLIDDSSSDGINIQVEYNQQNYIITLDTSSGGTGPALRAAQLNMALTQARPAQLNAKGEVEAVPNNSSTYNLAQAGFTFVTPGSDAKKWYRIEFARLKEVNGVVSRHTDRVGTFVDYGTPYALDSIVTAKGWDPIADINADASPGRITWREFKSAGPKNIFQVDFHADAVANLTMDLSIADKSSNVNLTIPRIFADFNLDWSTRAARARIEQAKQAATDQA
ncbi:MAG: hypothetical protein EBU81_14215, partial [Proteobacteria bacterium]|nr:hypothetical protein [Pseudomonadota bacterium]